MAEWPLNKWHTSILTSAISPTLTQTCTFYNHNSMFLRWGFRVTHQHHIACFSYLAYIILTISTTPTLTQAYFTMNIVQTQLYRVWGSEEHTTVVSQHWSTGLGGWLLCFSYLTHITLTKWYKHTHKHNHTQAHEVTLLKNTNKNNQNNTQKPKDTHTPNKDKYQDTHALKNTAVLFILGFHVTEFCPAISPISSQSLIQMKVHQQC